MLHEYSINIIHLVNFCVDIQTNKHTHTQTNLRISKSIKPIRNIFYTKFYKLLSDVITLMK